MKVLADFDIAHFGEAEDRVLFQDPAIFALEAFDALRAAENVAVLRKATLSDECAVDAHGNLWLKSASTLAVISGNQAGAEAVGRSIFRPY